jgi:DNA-binding GntR family transcriptional regulator
MLNYRSLKDHVYDYISSQIRNKTLKPGEKINENIICDNLKISRTPVREALIQLSNEGYIEQIPRRGFVVKEVSLERAHNIYAIIGTLEALAAAECLKQNVAFDLTPMQTLAEQMQTAIALYDFDRYYHLQHDFHQCFIDASYNEDLIRLLESLKKTFIKQSYNGPEKDTTYQEAFYKTNEEHYKILELFENRDSDALRAYITDVHWHIKYAAMEILI